MNKLIQDSHDAWAKEAIALRAENATLKQQNERLHESNEEISEVVHTQYLAKIQMQRQEIEQLRADNAALLEFAYWATSADLISVTRFKAIECIAKLGGERNE